MGTSCCRIVLILGVSLLLIQFVSGAITVDDAKIQTYLTNYIDAYEALTGRPVDRVKLIAKYTVASNTLSISPAITLNEVAKLHISVQEDSATLTNNDACDINNQLSMDEFLVKLGASSSSAKDEFQETYEHFKTLDTAGKKFCNFAAYLVCKDDPKTPGTHHCLCPSEDMIWETNKCVFQKLKQCDNLPKGFLVDWFANFDFINDRYTMNIAPNCESNYYCQHGSNTCELDKNFDYILPPLEIVAFLNRHIPLGFWSDEFLRREMLRIGIHDITLPYRRAELRDLSLELHMENRLLGYGQPCDNSALDTLMKTYNPRDNKDFSNLHLNGDSMRLAFMESVVRDPASRICNHFGLLGCSTAGTCDCKENMVWDSSRGSCSTKTNYPCPDTHSHNNYGYWDSSRGRCSTKTSYHCPNYHDMKLFYVDFLSWHFTYDNDKYAPYKLDIREFDPDLVDVYDDENIEYNIRYYKLLSSKCEQGTTCTNFGVTESHGYCLKEDGSIPALETMLEEFNKKFVIDFDKDCSASDHTKLFQLTSSASSGASFEDLRKLVEAIVASPTKYCRIREHATCSLAGKCTCVPPAVRTGTICTSPLYGDCGTKSSHHLELDRLVMPPKNPATQAAGSNLFCPMHLKCKNDHFISKELCSCEHDKYGVECNINPNNLVRQIEFDTQYLPTDLQTPDGRKLLDRFHVAMDGLENVMKADYDQPCSTDNHAEQDSILDFLTRFRDTCACYDDYDEATRRYNCANFPCQTNPDYGKARFEAMVQLTNDLAAKPSSLCERFTSLKCISGTCGCPEDFFYENGRCNVELGVVGVCKKYDYCREGTDCTGTNNRCTSTNPIVIHIVAGDLTAAQYVSKVKETHVAYLKGKYAGLSKYRTLRDGLHCNPSWEAELKITILELDPLLDSITKGNIQHDRGEIRLMETLAMTIESFTKYPFREFCREMLTCSPTTNTCERKRQLFTPFSGSAPRRFNQDNLLLVALIIYRCFNF